jgi:hypothetical protein
MTGQHDEIMFRRVVLVAEADEVVKRDRRTRVGIVGDDLFLFRRTCEIR